MAGWRPVQELEWHTATLRASLRVGRWWSADRALDFLGRELSFGHGLHGIEDAAGCYYGRDVAR
ncbi:MAG: hypothetical protein R3F59_31675 [Myxococcota bacterium]